MILVFAVDGNWNIGYEGDLLLKISEDLKRFRRITINNIIIMGRKTFESLPGSKALDSRINIVVTRKEGYNPPNTIVVNSIEDLLEKLEEINPDNKMQNYFIGGGILADYVMKYCKQGHITKIFKNFEKADTSLHNLDEDKNWRVVGTSDVYYQDDVGYQYLEYVRVGED